MIRSAASKVMWVGRATVFLVGLAVILALVLGVATSAMGANGQNFILGKLNNAATKVTGLVGNVDGAAALRVTNPNAGTNDTALDLRVQAGEAPMRVNSATKVANLNADKLDGQSFNCPGGTLFHEGVCIDAARRAALALYYAEKDCLDEGKRLPTVAELQTFRVRGGHDFTGQFTWEWTSARDHVESTYGATIVYANDGTVGWNNATGPSYYRCVTPAF